MTAYLPSGSSKEHSGSEVRRQRRAGARPLLLGVFVEVGWPELERVSRSDCSVAEPLAVDLAAAAAHRAPTLLRLLRAKSDPREVVQQELGILRGWCTWPPFVG